MSGHTYSNTKPGPKFDRLGYLRQISDSELDAYQRQVLTHMATFCTEEMVLAFKAYNSQTIAPKLRCSPDTVSRALKVMKDARLLTKEMKRGRMFWRLPSEEAIALYLPKK